MPSEPHLYGRAQWKQIRKAILSRDGYICAYCGQDATTVDHVVAVANGGGWFDRDNLVACCSRCNSKKRDTSLSVFLSRSSTPPVSAEQSLPVTHSSRPVQSVVGTD